MFAGTPQAAIPSLEALLDSRHEVAAVLTRPDAPSGRGRQLQPSPVAEHAAAHGVEVLTPPTEFEAVRDALAAAGFTPEIAEVTMRAENTVDVAGEDAAKMQKLLDVLEDLDDVQEVFHNAALSE